MSTNLPTPAKQDSASGTKLYFNNYGSGPLELAANDVAAAINFFESKGFDNDAALTVSAAILDQAKVDNVSIYSLLDTLKVFDNIQLSGLVAEILNNNRPITSSLGYKEARTEENFQSRNIAP